LRGTKQSQLIPHKQKNNSLIITGCFVPRNDGIRASLRGTKQSQLIPYKQKNNSLIIITDCFVPRNDGMRSVIGRICEDNEEIEELRK